MSRASFVIVPSSKRRQNCIGEYGHLVPYAYARIDGIPLWEIETTDLEIGWFWSFESVPPLGKSRYWAVVTRGKGLMENYDAHSWDPRLRSFPKPPLKFKEKHRWGQSLGRLRMLSRINQTSSTRCSIEMQPILSFGSTETWQERALKVLVETSGNVPDGLAERRAAECCPSLPRRGSA